MMTDREYVEHLVNALQMLIEHFRDGKPIDWTIVPLEAQTEAMHIAHGIGNRLFVKNIWKGPMSSEQRLEIAKNLDEAIEAIVQLDRAWS